MTRDEIQLLCDYDRWADLKLLEIVAALNEEQYKKDLGASFGNIHGTFVHIISANQVWLNRWNKKQTVPMMADSFPSVDVVKKQWDTYNLEISNFLSGLTNEKLNEPLEYTDFKGNDFAQPLCQQMQHKINHSTYHRGQIVAMLKQLGVGVVSTDLINYIREKEKRG